MAPSNAMVERNRRNALKSTGPQTTRGKAIARRNAVRHGLTAADPSVFGVEEGTLFQGLHDQLVEELGPRSVLESGLVHRIAISLWRLRRATLIDSAFSAERVSQMPRNQDRIQRIIDRFNDCWRWHEVEERDQAKLRWARAMGLVSRYATTWKRLRRSSVLALDELREEMLEDVEGIDALLTLVHHLWDKCSRRDVDRLQETDIDKLAFLLGDSAETFPINYNETRIGGSHSAYTAIGEIRPGPGPMQEMLWNGLASASEDGLTPEIDSALQAAVDTLEQQRMVLSSPYDDEEHRRQERLAMLPDSITLERLTRYETHAERSLYRALDQLARMQGVTIHVLAARLSGADAAVS